MRLKLLTAIAAATLLAACASEPASTTQTTGTGTTTQTPPSVTRSPQEVLAAEAGDRVFFAFDRFALSADAQATLRRQATVIGRFPQARIMIEGHADERGTREYNLALGERRANAVRDFMAQLGVPAARITTTSFGKERPAVVGSNEAAWAQNRRAVTVLQ
ncbi:MAG: peptidoglycan-associated lipoprotein Pal [Alphaproteobacteria bacterium]|nr:peptidoglycan-associated lipoprotein Pal [Alphaproteobacteria bacterium]TAD91427.1 MAG: peptidoglycan-associated lipoprotein Pal [Alphaproteobacteria bacterium]